MSAVDLESLKRDAAEAAIEAEVRSGMALGLGTGSTARWLLEGVAARLSDGRLEDLVGVPTSEATAARCRELGIPLATLDQRPALDLAIDGADEIAPGLALIKGLGGAHLREKVVASAAAASSWWPTRPSWSPGWASAPRCRSRWRRSPGRSASGCCASRAGRRSFGYGEAGAWITDEGNLILDCRRDDWSDPSALQRALADMPGVVEHGLFLGMASAAYVAAADGVRVLAP